MSSQWQAEILKRFADREDIGKSAVYQGYWSEMPEQAVMELFQLIEVEYKLPAGLLRPNDSLSKLLEPIKTGNPFKWLVYQLRASDRQSELNDELAKRMQEHDSSGSREEIRTIDDLVRAWCGCSPKLRTA